MMMKSRHGIPLIGLGTYPLKGDEATETVRMAIELGYRHIDTAQMYGNEHAVGQGISSSGIARRDVFVVTKVDPGNLGAGQFNDSVRKSIDDIGLTPDLLLIHWPPANTEVEAVIDRLVAAKENGWTSSIGISNFPPSLMRRAQAAANGDLICNQVEFHPLLDQRNVLAVAQELNLDVTAYSPLVRGAALRPDIVQEIAKRHERPASEVVLRWIIQQGVAAIPMTRKRENAASNLNAMAFALTDEDMMAISGLGTLAGRTIKPSSMTGRWEA